MDAPPHLRILGIAQDGGIPQAGCASPCCEAAWRNPQRRRRVSCAALMAPGGGPVWMIDATPDFREQLHALTGARLGGILLTHGHIGHYLGLAHLGKEAMAVRSLPVFAMPGMEALLRSSEPWRQLVRLGQIEPRPLADGETIVLGAGLRVTPFLVPHRAELTETVAFRIDGPRRSAVYLPDIDAWELWDAPDESPGANLRRLVRSVDALWLDGTFFDERELPHRDLREIPHPRITETLRLLEDLPAGDRSKVRFTHLNHTNPALDPSSPAAAIVRAAGCRIGEEGERFEL